MTSYLKPRVRKNNKLIQKSFKNPDCMLFKFAICLAVLVIRKKQERFKVHFKSKYEIKVEVSYLASFF